MDNLDIIAQKITRARAAAAALSSSNPPLNVPSNVASNMPPRLRDVGSRIVLQASVPHYPAARNVIPRTLQVIPLVLRRRYITPPPSILLTPHSPLPSPPLSPQSIKISPEGRSFQPETSSNIVARTAAWALDSVGLYSNFTSYGGELLRYGQLPSLKAGDPPLRTLIICTIY